MLQVAHTIATAPDFSGFAAARATSNPSEAQRIRFAAADLCRQGRLAEADLLTFEALQQYPDSEDVLVMRALICEVRHDWSGAATVLGHLLRVQGKAAPAETWCHWVRVLRCDGQLGAAHQAVLQALQHHPAHPALASELAQLEAMGVAGEQRAA